VRTLLWLACLPLACVSTPKLAAPRTPLPDELSNMENGCSHDVSSPRLVVHCTSDGHLSSALFTMDDASLPGELPHEPLARVVLASYCSADPDEQTTFVDGRNLWIHYKRRAGLQFTVHSLMVADRTRLTTEDAAAIHAALDVASSVDLRNDAALKAAIEAREDAKHGDLALRACAARGH
jgi:hypothetical protein